MKVEWTHSGQDVQSFNVIRQGGVTSQQTAPHATVEASERSFIDDEIEPGDAYRYSVVAVGAGAKSAATPHTGGEVVMEPGIDLVLGQWNAPGDPAGIFAFFLFLAQPDWPQGDATHAVTVTGPASYSRTFNLSRFELPALTSLGRLQLWINVGVSDLGPVTDLPLYEIDVGGTSVTDLTPLYGKADTMQNLSAYSLGLSNTDIEFLTNFTNLRSLNLGGNELNDLSSLVANAGLGEGDTLTINNNCLDLSVGSTASLQIEALEARGVEVLYEPQRTCVP